MNIIPFIIGAIMLAFVTLVVAHAVWNVLEITCRITMVVIYATAYLIVTLCEIVRWFARLPYRLGRTMFRAIFRS